MKKLLVLVLVSVLVFGCKKDEDQKPEVTQQEISFGAILVDPGVGMKDFECKLDGSGNLLEPDYAEVDIFDGTSTTTYYPLVFRIDGVLYTQNIKLDIPPNGSSHTFQVVKFLLWDDNNTPADNTDDQVVMGTPLTGSDYAVYVANSLSFDFTVTAFMKVEVEIDVLCYQDHLYDEFGFAWFQIDEIVIREQCFFGDICVKHPSDYANSNYSQQPGGVALDMPAIVNLVVKRNGVEVEKSPFTNNIGPNYGAGAPLCIEYPDHLNEVDTYTCELWILVKWGDTFVFKHFHTWTWTDANLIPNGGDGIVEFVLGECNLSDTDLQLAPYQDLPTTASVTINHSNYNGITHGYWDLYVNSVNPTGSYDLPVLVDLAAWCADGGNVISAGLHNMNVYSSLYSHDWPAGVPWTLGEIAQVNWLFNNLDQFGIDVEDIATAEQGQDIQEAVWYLLEGDIYQGVNNYLAQAAAGQTSFVPLPGGWAACIFVKNNDPGFQLIITAVDP
jgi:hypothetical protein